MCRLQSAPVQTNIQTNMNWVKGGARHCLTLIRAAVKKSIEWRLQVQLAFSMKVNLAPSRPE